MWNMKAGQDAVARSTCRAVGLTLCAPCFLVMISAILRAPGASLRSLFFIAAGFAFDQK
jgi:hypothetical protein